MRVDGNRISVRRAALAWGAALFLAGCVDWAGPRCKTAECEAEQARIRNDVLKELNARPALRFDNIAVQAVDGSVYLSGMVSTELERDYAVQLARSVSGVKEVHETLGIRGNGGGI